MQENRKKSVGAPKDNDNAKKQLGQNEPIVSTKSTAAQIAEEVGVSESTVKRAEWQNPPLSKSKSGEILHLKKRASSKKP